ncbi:hypothetical protein BDP27DRAFT_1336504 [Rhodocollybia butyracea]|uniref:Uncharacterized protein n=1 Tax=Rhodocollybia butyracea TaxID=206335 RepID=A0A9P5PI72_9AGAR|nr:hypothetical protein BDP27DRAFT_1336504 [Rhodocollybia butyracea]
MKPGRKTSVSFAFNLNSVQSAWPQSILWFHTNAPGSYIMVCFPVRYNRRIYQFVAVDESITLGEEVIRNDPAPATGLVQDVGQYVHPSAECANVSVSVSESRCTLIDRRLSPARWGNDVHRKSILKQWSCETRPGINLSSLWTSSPSSCKPRPEAN